MPKITKQLVDSLKPPAKGDLVIWDNELPGFGVRVHAGGSKVYVVRYRRMADGKQGKVTVCRTCDAPPDKARGMARDVFAKVASGADPAGERAKIKVAPTVTIEAMFKSRIVAMRVKNRAMTDQVERVLLRAKNNAADSLGRNKAPGDVTAADIVKFVSTFYQAGHRGAADKARSYLAATFAWAIKSANDYTVAERPDWGVRHNPAADVAKDQGAIGVRERNLDAKEMKILWDACENGNAGFTEGVEVCLRLIMACGQRVMETLRMEGAEIDLEERVWRIPAHKTKGKLRTHIIPLPDIIIPDLRRLKEKHGDGTLFPGRNGSASEILGNMSVAHAVRDWRLSGNSGIEAWQPRDLRRTWKSRAHDAGVDRFTRDLIQQHAKGGDTGSKHYDRADYFPQMRKAMDDWSVWLTATVTAQLEEALAA